MWDVFTAWDSIIKSSQQEKLLKVADILKDKDSSSITFTAVTPEGGTEKYVLGSIEGNSKFLLGYCNPGFRFLPYHYIVIDPNITEEEAQKLFDDKGHPSNPRYWMDAGIEPFLEGDDEGITHPSFTTLEDREESDTKQFLYKDQSYIADPSIQVIYSLSDDRVYDWGLLRNTYFASQNEDIYNLMELTRTVDSLQSSNTSPIKEISKSYKIYQYDEDVVPIIKSISKPGNIYRVGEYYGICTQDSIQFYDDKGVNKSIEIRGNTYNEIPLNPEEGPGSLVLLSFIDKYLNLDVSLLETYVE